MRGAALAPSCPAPGGLAPDEELAVLLVDDNPIDVKILGRALAGVGGWKARVTTCQTYEEALEAAASGKPDVALFDYQLGRRSGLDLVRALRERSLDVPVILLTSSLDERLALDALHAGVSDCLTKDSVSPKSLARSVSNAVSRHRLQRELERYRARLEQTVRDLQARSEEIQTFYHVLSHELKTPLTAAIEFVSLVAEGHGGELRPEQTRLLLKAEKNCRLLVTYIDDMFDVSRLETGKLGLDVAPVSCSRVLEDLAEAWRARCAERGLDFRVRDATGGRSVLADERRLLQILGNLLSNALKFTQSGTIGLEARVEEAEAFFSVSDTGRGIPPEKRERIFDRLSQVHRTDATERGGLGLGLHIARELVHLHGGRISVDSKPGRGSTFTFVLPLCRAA